MRAQRGADHYRTAILFRTGLQIVWLAHFGLRLANLTSIANGEHLRKLENTNFAWWITFEPEETKNGRYIDKPVPADVASALQDYLETYRPILCHGCYGGIRIYKGNRLWVSSRGVPQGRNSIYKSVRKAIKRELGIDVCPHLFRDAIATAIARRDPARASSASLRLGNTEAIVARHYRHASTLEASNYITGKIAATIDNAIGRRPASCRSRP